MTNEMLKYEADFFSKGYRHICGIDEAGRGPLAGPVCAAAVILPHGTFIEGVNDSKKLSAKKRELLYDKIIEAAVACSAEFVFPDVIDEINIRQATHLAMERAVCNLNVTPDILLVDGNDKIPFPGYESLYIVKGDTVSHTIAAASIIAKVTRDRYMTKLSAEYPEYGFEKHKGYGTKAHIEAIRRFGVKPVHRRTFMTAKVLGTNNEQIQ